MKKMKKILIRIESHSKSGIWWMESRILEFSKILENNYVFLTNSKILIESKYFWEKKYIFSNYFSFLWILKDIFSFRNFDIIDSNWLRDNIISSLNFLIFFPFYKIKKTKFFLSIHWNQGILEIKWFKKFIYNFILKIWFFISDKIIVVSEELKDFLIKNYKIQNKKIEIILNFINFPSIIPTDNVWKWKKALTVSRLDNHKIWWILKTIDFCLENNISLDIYWDWESLKNLQKKFEKNEKINFLGFKKQEEINYQNYNFVFAMWRALLEWIANWLNWILIWYDDLICEINLENYEKIKYSNFSGRWILKEKIYLKNIWQEKKKVFYKIKDDFKLENIKNFYK